LLCALRDGAGRAALRHGVLRRAPVVRRRGQVPAGGPEPQRLLGREARRQVLDHPDLGHLLRDPLPAAGDGAPRAERRPLHRPAQVTPQAFFSDASGFSGASPSRDLNTTTRQSTKLTRVAATMPARAASWGSRWGKERSMT